MQSLFRRKSAKLVEDSVQEVTEDDSTTSESERRPGYTPSKRELGQVTPKRSVHGRRQAEAPPANRREAARRSRDRQKASRAETMEGMRRGDERYLVPRDRGPERALVRDIIDSRRTIGTWFFGGALIVLLGSSAAMPPVIRLVSNLLWAMLALGVVVDSVFICRRIKKLVGERYPDTDQRMRSLYTYGVMRSITFRRMRMPKPRVDPGESI